MNSLLFALIASTLTIGFDGTDAFETKRRDLWRDPSGKAPFANRLDFSKREVRDFYTKRILSEAARPDVDTVVLDFVKAGLLLPLDRERETAAKLGDFVTTLRMKLNGLGKSQNRTYRIIANAPKGKWDCRGLGYDVTLWKDRKDIDDYTIDTNCCLSAYNGTPENVPELLTTFDGRKITTKEEWERIRKPELKEFFLREIYGRRPGEIPAKLEFSALEPDKTMMDGRAVRKRVRVSYGDKCGESSFTFTAFIPADATAAKPAPAFVLICNRSAAANLDPERVVKSPFWPAERIVERGYAAIAFFNGDVAKDYDWGYDNGVYSVFQKPEDRNAESWGILSAWSWGASRVMDWIEKEATLDAKHVGVVGHSRGGKTSLFTGVYDERFAMACVNCSGCGGAKLNHLSLPFSEHYDQIWNAIGCWFCGNFEKYVGREREENFDAHEWIALMAPRLVAIASASEDSWAGQQGEYFGGVYASPAWEFYGKKGLVSDGFPGDSNPKQAGSISYHMRKGEHTLDVYDWDRYLDFADAHGWRRR